MVMFCNFNKCISLMKTWRKLWVQHVMWTRSFVISTASDLGDLDFVTQRLMQNPGDMAEVIRPFYGNQTAATFQRLFTEHLSIAAKLVNAAKAGDTESVAELEEKWYQNADEIAAFLAAVNRYWNKQQWQDFLHSHLKMTKSETVYRLSGKYADDIMTYDKIEREALQMADYMTIGMAHQFRL